MHMLGNGTFSPREAKLQNLGAQKRSLNREKKGVIAPLSPQRPGSPRAPIESAPSEGRGPDGSGRAIGPAPTVGMPMIQRGGGGRGDTREGESPPTFSRK